MDLFLSYPIGDIWVSRPKKKILQKYIKKFRFFFLLVIPKKFPKPLIERYSTLQGYRVDLTLSYSIGDIWVSHLKKKILQKYIKKYRFFFFIVILEKLQTPLIEPCHTIITS